MFFFVVVNIENTGDSSNYSVVVCTNIHWTKCRETPWISCQSVTDTGPQTMTDSHPHLRTVQLWANWVSESPQHTHVSGLWEETHSNMCSKGCHLLPNKSLKLLEHMHTQSHCALVEINTFLPVNIEQLTVNREQHFIPPQGHLISPIWIKW